MRIWSSVAMVVLTVPACASSVPGGVGEGRTDATPIEFAADARRSDAMPGPRVDAGVPNPADASEAVEATVTASCLFVRSGPGTENAKLTCTDSGAWCNADNDVCIPMGDTASVVGAGQAGAGCDVDWYPVQYRTYQGHACGSFLAFPTSAANMLPTDHRTLFPTVAEGPQG